MSTMRPKYSWPTAMGTGMVFCAQASQMIDVHVGAADRGLGDLDEHVVGADLRLRDVLHPDAGSRFALDQCFHLMSSMVAADLDEGRQRAIELRVGQARGHLRADARLALRHHREREADDVHAFAQQPVGETRGQRRVADHRRG